MRKGKIILIIIVTVILGVILGFTVFAIQSRLSTDDMDEIVDSLNDNLKDLNQLLLSENLSKAFYDQESDNECYKYVGDNQDKIIKIINDIYYNPFGDYSYFNYIEEENELYVCRPQKCVIKDVSFDSYKLFDSDDVNEKIIESDLSNFILIKDKNKWKFKYPVYSCEGSVW